MKFIHKFRDHNRVRIMVFNDTFNNISAIVYLGSQFYWWGKPEKTTTTIIGRPSLISEFTTFSILELWPLICQKKKQVYFSCKRGHLCSMYTFVGACNIIDKNNCKGFNKLGVFFHMMSLQ